MKSLLVPVLLLLSFTISAQSIPVYNGTVKIGSVSEDTLFFAFAKGDQVIVDFESVGRELKEFEILKYPRGSVFREDEKTKIPGKKISIDETGVYQVRMANRSGTERVCKLNIRRIPGT